MYMVVMSDDHSLNIYGLWKQICGCQVICSLSYTEMYIYQLSNYISLILIIVHHFPNSYNQRVDMISICGTSAIPSSSRIDFHSSCPQLKILPARAKATFTTFASKPGGFSFNPLAKKCERCAGKGGIECPGCKGTGRNKKNGNIFERWKCYDCQGFGMKSCPECGKGGLTPEQRGER